MTITTDIAAKSATIKFEQQFEQTIEGITRVSGFVRARHFMPLIDVLDLDANPRSSKVGRVTTAIMESIANTPDEFPFKSKGVLLGATDYERLDRGRIRTTFRDAHVEGILDGGHNTLAIGLHLLKLAGVPDVQLRKAKNWFTFRELWDSETVRLKELRGRATAFDSRDDDLNFLIPVELIVPSDPDDQVQIDQFQSSILEICEARNNNAELVVGAKSNKAGFYDDLRKYLPEGIAARIEWKPNEPGTSVKVQDLIAMAWLPLSLLNPMPVDEGERPVVPPIPQNLYRNKGECMQKFHDLMSMDAVTHDRAGNADLYNPNVRSALKLAAQLPELFDLIYAEFPNAYNANEGRYGRITAVNKMNVPGRSKTARFSGAEVQANSPDGYLYPLLWGLTALMRRDEDGRVEWTVDPAEFLKDHLAEIAQKFKLIMQVLDYDPVKIGKAPAAYEVVKDAYAAILADSRRSN